MERKKVLSGIRATGKLHLGNYLGALVRFARMSQDDRYRCLFFVADLHTLTTFKGGAMIQDHLPNIVLDYLAAGVDPDKSFIYVQSDVPEVAELAWYLSCLTPVGHLNGLPTYKDKVKNLKAEDNNAGLLNYPVLMAADILGPRADLVPVGKDQKPHLELAQSIAQRFNREYGHFFPVPDSMSDEMVMVPGLSLVNPDGGFPKMGKSDANTININDTADEIWARIRVAPVDTQRVRRNDPGDPSRCSIFALHQFVSSGPQIAWSQSGCSSAEIGCLDCKKVLSDNVNELFAEFRERRAVLAQKPGFVREVLSAGRDEAKKLFTETVGTVRESMGIRRWGG